METMAWEEYCRREIARYSKRKKPQQNQEKKLYYVKET